MKASPRFSIFLTLLLAATLGAAGCKSSQDQAAAATDQNMSQDPSDANSASATDTAATTASQPASQPAAAQTVPQAQPISNTGSYDATADDSGEQPVAQAQQPPPPLPEYAQPPCPGDGYIWTPGYWSYHPTGYFWVPGVWTRAPFVGALWTPPYWGFNRGVYALFPGHWGNHIGFYGGINYGFGYTGLGYHGGYWDGGAFRYNRVVNNINTTVIHNVYTYNIVNKTTIVNRVSYNGGNGGIPVRPRPVEIAAVREPRAPVMTTQIRHEEAARADHAQFVEVNHGKPATPAFERPIEADHDVHPAPRPVAVHPEPRVEHPAEAHGPHPPEHHPPAHPDKEHHK
jgi:hypothetical protein